MADTIRVKVDFPRKLHGEIRALAQEDRRRDKYEILRLVEWGIERRQEIPPLHR